MFLIRFFRTISRYLVTIRFLKPIQIIYRLRRLVTKPLLENIKQKATINQRRKSHNWISSCPKNRSFFQPNKFFLLNEWGEIDPEIWTDKTKSLLWQYNQNYFDDLNSEFSNDYLEEKIYLINKWIETSKKSNSVGWDPYPTSLRIVNWIKFQLIYGSLEEKELKSLFVQLSWLEKNIEWHILGNHIFVNAKALIFGGLFFEGKNADNWLETGLSILSNEIDEQFKSDGMHFEKSFMYHGLLLEDLLDLVNIFQVYNFGKHKSKFENIASKAMKCLQQFCHPDGNIPFFNDATFGVSSSTESLLKYFYALGLKLEKSCPKTLYLPESGYVRSWNSDACLFCDIGDIGPDYIPSHAHADSLSFEISLFRNRLIVNSGISEYGNGPERLRQRGTKAHSTLSINQQNSSDVWGGFRVARRARAINCEIQDHGSQVKIKGGHNGYKNLFSDIIHHRTWELSKNSLNISDQISGKGKKIIEINFHIHPSVSIRFINEKKVSLTVPTGQESFLESLSVVSWTLRKNTFHPGFNETVSSQLLQINCNTQLPAGFDFLLYWDS